MPAVPTAAVPSPDLLLSRRQRPIAIPSSSSSNHPRLRLPTRRRAASMSAEAQAPALPVAPPAHPTYDLKAVIALALSEDAGERGDVSCMATIPTDVKAEATFIAKEDGVIAGVSLADLIFNQVDPSLKVEWFENDGNYVHKGLQFGKVYGCARSIIVAERVVLNFMQRMSGIATITKAMARGGARNWIWGGRHQSRLCGFTARRPGVTYMYNEHTWILKIVVCGLVIVANMHKK